MQCDSGGARARSEERALGLTPFSQPKAPVLHSAPLSLRVEVCSAGPRVRERVHEAGGQREGAQGGHFLIRLSENGYLDNQKVSEKIKHIS